MTNSNSSYNWPEIRRTVSRIVFCTAVLACAAALYAPIVGDFPGYDELSAQADAIVVARIEPQPVMINPGAGGPVLQALPDYTGGPMLTTVYIRNVLKDNSGTLQLETTTVLGLQNVAWNVRSGPTLAVDNEVPETLRSSDSFPPTEGCYLIYLAANLDRKTFQSINCPGATVDIPCTMTLTVKRGETTATAIRRFLKEVAGRAS